MCEGGSPRGGSGGSGCLCEALHLLLCLCQCPCVRLLRVGGACVLCVLLRMLQCCLCCSQLVACMHTRLPLFGSARCISDKATLREETAPSNTTKSARWEGFRQQKPTLKTAEQRAWALQADPTAHFSGNVL